MFAFKNIFIVLIAAGLVLAACGAPGAGGSDTGEVQVTLTEFGIESSVTEFKAGVPYHFVVTNEGAVNHEFMIMPPLEQEHSGMDMQQLDEMALAMIDESELTPGTTKTLDFTFSEPASAGSLEFACHTPGHYEAGMKLPIVVE